MTTQTSDQLRQENERLQQEVDDLRRRLEEAEETLDAIRTGEVDAVLVQGDSEAVFTLESADRPYRLLVEQMTEGAATLTVEGVILYCNRRFADLLKRPIHTLIGQLLGAFITPASRPAVEALLHTGQADPAQGEVELLRADGQPVPVYLGVSPLREGAIGLCLMVTDLTQHRHYQELQRTQQALRQSEEQLRVVFEQTTGGIAQTDLTGRFTLVNDRYCQIVGRSREQLLSLRMQDLTHPDDLHRNLDLFQQLVEGEGQPFVIEKRYLRPDGSPVWVNNSVSLIRDLHGKPKQVVAVTLDITDRKHAEQSLHAALDAMPQIVWSARPDGYLDYYNERWYEYTGFPRGQFGQAGWEPVLHPDDVERCVKTYFDCIREGRPYQIEHRFKDRKTGGYRWFLGRALPVRDEAGRIVRWIGTCTDIDDTKRAEERLRLLWEAATMLLTTDNPDAMLRDLFAKIGPRLALDCYLHYGVTDTGDALRLESCLGIPESASRALARLEIDQTICDTAASQRQPMHVIHVQQSDDPPVQLLRSLGIRVFTWSPLLSAGRLLGTLSFASRTRDQFDAEEQTFLETLCHYITLAYERFGLLNELKEADRRKDEFLATLAHELRNPLAPVRNAVQVIRLKGSEEPEVRWSRDVIDRQVAHLTRLVDDLLDITRITRDKLELRKERVELTEVIKAAVETSRPLIEQRGHELTVSLPPEPVYLSADLVRLAQVFMNLLTNAAKYTERGGRVWLTAKRQEGEILVQVKDTGVGIPAEKLPRLFELFFQVDPSLERAQGGLGIGLSLVRRLVELHGGTVKAQSAGLGEGSEFTVHLPILAQQPAPAPQPATGEAEKKAISSQRILVVDDIQDSADLLAMLLRLLGNTVEIVHDGLNAVEMAERFLPDVVLLDIGLPKLNGYDACRRIREHPWGQSMVLIALSGWGGEEDVRRAKEAGFDAHLVKPVDPDALQKVLATLKPRPFV
jgi:PAS domain S-box-containing protein